MFIARGGKFRQAATVTCFLSGRFVFAAKVENMGCYVGAPEKHICTTWGSGLEVQRYSHSQSKACHVAVPRIKGPLSIQFSFV